MERTFTGYANYGVLGKESQTIYTAFAPEATADFSEEVIFYCAEKLGNCRKRSRGAAALA